MVCHKIKAKQTLLMLYTIIIMISINNTIYMRIQNTGRLNCFRYERFINSWLQFKATRGERHNSYYPNPIPTRGASCDVSTVEDPTLFLNGRNSTLCLPQWSNLNWLFSKSSNSQDHLFRAWRHLHTRPISCLGVYYDNGNCHILCAWA